MIKADKKFTRRYKLTTLPLAVALIGGLHPSIVLSSETLCAYRFTRMAAAQTSRVIKEVVKCVARNPSTYLGECVPRVDDENDLVAPDRRLTRALKHVERHGNEKFPRKCDGVRSDFFAPACHAIVDTSGQLRRCLYNDHTLPFVEEALALADQFTTDGECARKSLHRFRFLWRDWMRLPAAEPDARFDSKLDSARAFIAEVCGDEEADEFARDLFDRLRTHSADIRAVVPFDQRR